MLYFDILSYFMKLFTPELIDYIVAQTNLYSRQHGRNIDLSKQELLGFIGVMILTGYRPIHDKRGLWSAEEDISVSVKRNNKCLLPDDCYH